MTAVPGLAVNSKVRILLDVINKLDYGKAAAMPWASSIRIRLWHQPPSRAMHGRSHQVHARHHITTRSYGSKLRAWSHILALFASPLKVDSSKELNLTANTLVIVIDIKQNSPDQVPPLLSRQAFSQEVSKILQGRHVSRKALLHCHGFTNEMIADAIGFLSQDRLRLQGVINDRHVVPINISGASNSDTYHT